MSIVQHYVIALLTTASTVFILSIFVYFKNPHKSVNKTFAFYSLCIVIWSLGQAYHNGASNRLEAVFWARYMHMGVVFISTAFVHFTLALLEQDKLKHRLITILYIASCVFLFFNFTSLFIPDAVLKFPIKYYLVAGPVYPLFLIFWLGGIAYALSLLYKAYHSSTGVRRNQLKYLFWATLSGYIGGASNFFPVFDIHLYPYNPFGTYTIPIYSGIVAYAITRYRFMDIRLVFNRTMAYSLSAGLLTGFFIVFVLTITKFISTFADVDSFKISVVAALVIALLFNPLRNRVQTLVDKVFYKKTYDYYTTIRKVSHDLASMLDFKKIYSFVGNIIFSTLGLKNIYLLSAVPIGDYKVVYSRSFGGDEDKEEEGDGKGEEEWREDDVVATRSREEALNIDGNSEMVKLLRTSDDIVIKDELPGIKEILGQETIDNITTTLKPFNGEAVMPVFVDNKLEFLMILGGKLSGDIFTNEDINLLGTISHETAIAIKNAQLYKEKVLSEGLASMGMMSATFAHEIRNPLTSIKTFAQLIPEKYTDTEFRNTFSKIVIDEIERIDGLIRDLMDFSSKEIVPRLNDLDITSLIDETLEYLKGRLELEKRNINVEKIYKSVKINITGDSKKLKQAFINIMTNSCQAMDENGVLKVNINQNGRDVDITITDTGKGILPQDITRIFDPFYTTKSMGVGLGLAISRKIIEDHGGRIAVESKLSKGTTFKISLPV